MGAFRGLPEFGLVGTSQGLDHQKKTHPGHLTPEEKTL